MADFLEELGAKLGGHLALLDAVDGRDLKWSNKPRLILPLRGEERAKLKTTYTSVIICSYLSSCEIADVK